MRLDVAGCGLARGRACCGRRGRARRGIRTFRGRGMYILGYMRGRDGEGVAKVRGGRLDVAGCGLAAAGAGARGTSGWFGVV